MTAELDEDRFNMAIRKFLKHVGVTSQREIENPVRSGEVKRLPPNEGRANIVMKNAP